MLDAEGKPLHILYLHAAHINKLDPMYAETEPIEDERLRAMCPSCHRTYDLHWQEIEHELLLHRILLDRRFESWFMTRFTQVV
jgi:hypothetical protein